MDADRCIFWYEGKPWIGTPDRGIWEGDLRATGPLEARALVSGREEVMNPSQPVDVMLMDVP